MPLKSRIAFYWMDKTYDYFDYFIDIGEPSCWACGKWDQHCPDLQNPGAQLKEVFSFWNKHRYLERCHIVPKAHGGCNCEANLVLLCKECHKASPDTLNMEIFRTWVVNRRSWLHRDIDKMKVAEEEVGYKIDERDYQILMSDEFNMYLLENGVPVGGKFAWSTKFACLMEFKEKFKEDLIQEIYDKYDQKSHEYFEGFGE